MRFEREGGYSLTEVVTPASDFRLTTKAHVRDDLKIASGTDDAYLDRLIVSQSAAAAKYCNRVFALQTYKDTRSRFYRERMMVANVPLVSVSSVADDDAILSPDSDFIPDVEKGFLLRLDSCGNPRPWRAFKLVVTYVAGYTLPRQGNGGEAFTLPADLEEAVIRMIKARYLARDRDPYLKSENVPGVSEQTYWVPAGNEGNLAPDITDVLDRYCIPAVG